MFTLIVTDTDMKYLVQSALNSKETFYVIKNKKNNH